MPAHLQVQLPEELKGFYEECGYSPTTALENRTNARLRVRRDAIIRFLSTSPTLLQGLGARKELEGRVLIKDISRTGIGFLYHEQIFPEEQVEILFQNRRIHVTTTRCRRINDACYEVGGLVHSLDTIDDAIEGELEGELEGEGLGII